MQEFDPTKESLVYHNGVNCTTLQTVFDSKKTTFAAGLGQFGLGYSTRSDHSTLLANCCGSGYYYNDLLLFNRNNLGVTALFSPVAIDAANIITKNKYGSSRVFYLELDKDKHIYFKVRSERNTDEYSDSRKYKVQQYNYGCKPHKVEIHKCDWIVSLYLTTLRSDEGYKEVFNALRDKVFVTIETPEQKNLAASLTVVAAKYGYTCWECPTWAFNENYLDMGKRLLLKIWSKTPLNIKEI